MRNDLDRVESAISEATSMLMAVDGLAAGQVADLLGYDNPSMAYSIANPEKAQMPTTARFLLAAQRLSELGNTRFSALAHSDSWNLTRSRSLLVNRSLDDEQRELFKAFFRLEEAVDSHNWRGAESCLETMSVLVERARAEVAVARSVYSGDGMNTAVPVL